MLPLAPEVVAPQVGARTAAIGPVAEAFHQGVILRLQRRLGSAFPSKCALLSGDVAGCGSASWRPEAGAALRALNQGRSDEALMHAALAAAALGQEGALAVELRQPARLSLGGQVFTAAGETLLEARSGRVTLETNWGKVNLARQANRWSPESTSFAVEADWSIPVYFDHPGFADRFVQAWVEPIVPGREDFIVDWPPPPYENRALIEDAAIQMGRALRLLDELGSGYLDWIAPLFRGIAASPQKLPGVMQSGSYTWHAGVFSCGFPRSDAYLGEVIVHEISHQYYLLWNCVCPLVDKATAEDRFSALKGRSRPLERVLLAFHATANMALYWFDYVERFGTSPAVDRPFKMMRDHCIDFVKELDQAKGLTEAGRHLFEIQRDLLSERALCPLSA